VFATDEVLAHGKWIAADYALPERVLVRRRDLTIAFMEQVGDLGIRVDDRGQGASRFHSFDLFFAFFALVFPYFFSDFFLLGDVGFLFFWARSDGDNSGFRCNWSVFFRATSSRPCFVFIFVLNHFDIPPLDFCVI
jgi:hypothetical protein